MQITLDTGRGSFRGDGRIALHVGPGRGYLRPWYVRLNRGPGKATGPALASYSDGTAHEHYGKGDCGHPWPYHCNSAFCGRMWCSLSLYRVARPFVLGYTFALRIPAR